MLDRAGRRIREIFVVRFWGSAPKDGDILICPVLDFRLNLGRKRTLCLELELASLFCASSEEEGEEVPASLGRMLQSALSLFVVLLLSAGINGRQ